jgi:hypothetical protein
MKGSTLLKVKVFAASVEIAAYLATSSGDGGLTMIQEAGCWMLYAPEEVLERLPI